MRRFIRIVCVLLLCFFIGCKQKLKENNFTKDEYRVLIGNRNDTIHKLNGDVLYLFFETDFDNDLLDINIEKNKKEYYLTTDRSTGYADFIDLGKLSTFRSLEFSINKGDLIKVNDVSTNLIRVIYIKDSIVKVEFSNKPTAYK